MREGASHGYNQHARTLPACASPPSLSHKRTTSLIFPAAWAARPRAFLNHGACTLLHTSAPIVHARNARAVRAVTPSSFLRPSFAASRGVEIHDVRRYGQSINRNAHTHSRSAAPRRRTYIAPAHAVRILRASFFEYLIGSLICVGLVRFQPMCNVMRPRVIRRPWRLSILCGFVGVRSTPQISASKECALKWFADLRRTAQEIGDLAHGSCTEHAWMTCYIQATAGCTLRALFHVYV